MKNVIKTENFRRIRKILKSKLKRDESHEFKSLRSGLSLDLFNAPDRGYSFLSTQPDQVGDQSLKIVWHAPHARRLHTRATY